MLNTEISYQYRDAGNYKRGGQVVLNGTFPAGAAMLKALIHNKVEGGEFFIASQVGLPEVFPWLDPKAPPEIKAVTPDDHCWHELTDIEEVSKAATDTRTPSEFLDAVELASRIGWEIFDPAEKRP
jgi:hypothetical protein